MIATGNPCSSANATTSSAPDAGSSVPGTNGAPTSNAIRRAVTLSPNTRIASGDGPTHTRPASSTACAKSAFSDKNP